MHVPIGPMTKINWIPATQKPPAEIRDAMFILRTECGLAIGSCFSDGSGFDCDHFVYDYAICTESLIGLNVKV